MNKQYYYLVSSLPELVFDADSKSFDFQQFKEYVLEHIEANDAELVHALFYGADNENLLSLLYSEEKEWNTAGRYSRRELEDVLQGTDTVSGIKLPPYMREFLIRFENVETEQKQRLDKAAAEQLLLELFYREMESRPNKFISAIFTFERETGNIKAAYAGRKTGISVENILVGQDDINDALLKSNAPDFGLSRERDYAVELFHLIDTPDLLERERNLDLFRWRQIDEINTFEYFSIDAILGFMQKAATVNRWMKMDRETGSKMFEKMIRELREL
jgi:hypothetical protein